MLDELIALLQKGEATVYVGQPTCIYLKDNGQTVVLVIYRFDEL